eukprot:58750-Amphidinium_carterae.1
MHTQLLFQAEFNRRGRQKKHEKSTKLAIDINAPNTSGFVGLVFSHFRGAMAMVTALSLCAVVDAYGMTHPSSRGHFHYYNRGGDVSQKHKP